jgi:Fe-S-cluster-containing hydrogenase component 2
VWDEQLCIQCGKCVLVCPHSVIRAKIYDPAHLEHAPSTFKTTKPKWKEFETQRLVLGCINIRVICRGKSASRDMNYLLIKAQRLAATKTQFPVLQKAA